MVYVITSIDRRGNRRQQEAANLEAAHELVVTLRMSGHSAWAQIVHREPSDNA